MSAIDALKLAARASATTLRIGSRPCADAAASGAAHPDLVKILLDKRSGCFAPHASRKASLDIRVGFRLETSKQDTR